jgi:dipeptidyl-peptidase 4
MTNERRLGEEIYERAEQFLPWNIHVLVTGLSVEPNWIGRSDRFWFNRMAGSGTEFVLVDPVTHRVQAAFDHVEVARALGRATGRDLQGDHLPFTSIELGDDGSLAFYALDSHWVYDAANGPLQRDLSRRGEPGDEVRSPDGRWDAFVRGWDLWVRRVSTGVERALTADGTRDCWYGLPLPSPLAAAGLGAADGPVISWSPDGSRLLTQQIDQRGAPELPFLQSLPLDGTRRARMHRVAYPLPGDIETPIARAVIADPATGSVVIADHPPLPVLYYGSPISSGRVSWSASGDRVYLAASDRGYLGYRLIEILAETGASRTMVAESSDVGITPHGGNWSSSDGPGNLAAFHQGTEVLWWSERDGWPHLYLYDGISGALRRQVTAGAWVVQEVLRLDEQRRQVVFVGAGREAGRDPYCSYLYRVSLDGGEPELLTPDDAHHHIHLAANGSYFLDTASRYDQSPVTVLRDGHGRQVMVLETADVSRLSATGWKPPQRLRFKGRDGMTDLYGLVFVPSSTMPTTSGPATSLPILDFIYGGPQMNQAGSSFADSARAEATAGISSSFWHAQALAELGFAVVMIDGLGMPGRSKAHHDVSWRNLADGGIPDHLLGYRALAEQDPRVDAARVGIFGHSAGGYASAQAILRYPDVYLACVSSAGNHDHRLDKAVWVERYMGLPVGDHYRQQANASLAGELKGKLLLVHGDMDENVHLSSTLGLVDALIDANQDFDLLILPNRPHRFGDDPYFTRVRWDYFVRHVLGQEPPARYRIAHPQP